MATRLEPVKTVGFVYLACISRPPKKNAYILWFEGELHTRYQTTAADNAEFSSHL